MVSMVTSMAGPGAIVLVVDGVIDDEPARRATPVRTTPWTAKVPADWLTDDTVPTTNAVGPPDPVPDPGPAPRRTVPPEGGRNIPLPPAPCGPRREQPLAEGALMVTVRAVMGPGGVPVVAGAPVIDTQSPTATSDSEAVTVRTKVVEEDQLTVTWPSTGFCTSMEDDVGEMAATCPEAPGGGGVADGVVVRACDDATADPPQAPSSALAATATGTAIRRAPRPPARSSGIDGELPPA